MSGGGLRRFGDLITKRFSVTFSVVLVIGLAWQDLAHAVRPYIAWLLIGVIYLGFLRVNLGGLGEELRRWKRVVGMIVGLQIVIPALGYWGLLAICKALGWESEWAAGSLLILLAPAGAIVPTLCLLMHGRFERGILLLVIGSLLVPVTMPLMLWALLGAAGELTPLQVARFLAMVMLVPAAAAVITRRFTPKVVDAVHDNVPLLSVLGLCGVIVGAVAGLKPVLFDEPSRALIGGVLSTLAFLFAFAAAWFFAGGSPRDRMTLAIAATWTNIALAIVTANRLFAETAPLIVLATTLGEIPWNILFPPAQWFADKLVKAKEELGAIAE